MKLKASAVSKSLNVHPNTVTRMLRDGRLKEMTLDSYTEYVDRSAYERGRRDVLQELIKISSEK